MTYFMIGLLLGNYPLGITGKCKVVSKKAHFIGNLTKQL
jgi:hypothetical protein